MSNAIDFFHESGASSSIRQYCVTVGTFHSHIHQENVAAEEDAGKGTGARCNSIVEETNARTPRICINVVPDRVLARRAAGFERRTRRLDAEAGRGGDVSAGVSVHRSIEVCGKERSLREVGQRSSVTIT